MFSQAVLLSVLAALAEARFGQEQTPISAIGAVTSGGASGVAATLAGSAIGTLLAAANPCAKLQKADEIIAQLGTGADSVKAAQGLVAAEQNFNPFVVSIPTVCGDPTLPASEILRGIVPLIDPAVADSDLENANSAKSLTTAFSATGLSVAQVMIAAGFSNFTAKDLSGNVVNVGDAAAAPVPVSPPADDAAATTPPAASTTDCGPSVIFVTSTFTPTPSAAPADCGAPVTTLITKTVTAGGETAAPSAAPSAAPPAAAPPAGSASTVSTIAGLDFGVCVPTIKFEAGLNGRKDTEFTFQAIDPVVNKGQQEALNPNIITNRICDQLTNVCNANAAAKTACLAAKAQISDLGTRDVTTADAWNTALGFAGADTNPDNAPQAGLVGHT